MIIEVLKEHDVNVVRLKGSLDVSLQKKLKDKLTNISEAEENDIILDFAKVTFIDSSCLGSLVSLTKMVREKKGDIKLSNLSEDVLSIFQITRLDKVFEIFDKNEDAVKSFFRRSI